MTSHDRWRSAHLGTLVTLGFAIAWSGGWSSPAEAVSQALSGSHSEGTSFIALWLHLVVFVGSALVTHAAVTERLAGAVYPELLRVGTMRRWLASWAVRAGTDAGLSVGALGLGIVAAVVMNSEARGASISWQGFDRVLIFALGVGVMQGLFYWAAMLATTVLTGRVQAALPVMGVIIAFMLPPARAEWSPVGAASLPAGLPVLGQLASPLMSLVVGCGVAALVCGIASARRDIEFI